MEPRTGADAVPSSPATSSRPDEATRPTPEATLPAPAAPSETSDVIDLRVGPCHLRIRATDEVAAEGRRLATSRVARQLGGRPFAAGPQEPDLTVELGSAPAGRRLLLGTGEYAATEDDFLVLQGGGKRPVEMTLPFDRVGRGPTMRCTPTSPPLPLLVPLVNLTALHLDVLPLHAAAFDLDGLGVLVTGWSRSGKTETLLAFGRHGARYVGDEWVYLHPDGTITGLPEPMRVWSWHLAELGDAARPVPRRTRARLRALDVLTDDAGPGLERRLPSGARRVRHLLREQRNVRLPPADLLPVVDRSGLDVVILTESHDADTTEVEPVATDLVAERVAAMLPLERAPLTAAYQAYRYAFPDRRCELLEGAPARERGLLHHRLLDVPALRVRHPYPFRFEQMAAALAPWLDRLRA
jgi:hypothetical protein